MTGLTTDGSRPLSRPTKRRHPGSLARILCLALVRSVTLLAQTFQLPTANHALFEPGREEQFFVGTVGKPWTSGCFGCVRSENWQMHEGLDIKCVQRDKHGEPEDPVRATADGVVAYITTHPALSNYGNYIVIAHRVDGLEVYSLYAHLKEVRPGLKAGDAVKAGDPIAVMGRTSNTRQGISKERAHVHFELNLLVNDRFAAWFEQACPGQRNDHGAWNGQNLLGLDPRAILLLQARQGPRFKLSAWLQNEPEICRVLVRATHFPWLRRYAALTQRNPVAERDGVAGYELALDFNGVPIRLTPRAASEIKSPAKFQLLSVNEPEYHQHPCRRLVISRGGQWQLTGHGTKLLEQLTF